MAGPKTVKELAGILSAERTRMTRNLGVFGKAKMAEHMKAHAEAA